MKFNFSVDSALSEGIARLSGVLGYTLAEDGLAVTAVMGERAGIKKDASAAVIYYRHRAEFFRELGLLCEHYNEAEVEIFEDTAFRELSTMVDTARYGAATVPALCELCDRLALMGYSAMLLYIEDNVKLEGYPYFGYQRDRYTPEELRAIDDYAYAYGIEVIGCVECYGHMERYLYWPNTTAIRDTASVLLAREEKTFALIDTLIKTFADNLRSRRIHIGMDEAWDMGRGKFLDIHGYVPPAEIFAEYMERLMQILGSHGMQPMMWSDMYFRANDADRQNRYYGSRLTDPEAVAKQIPEGMTLVFWHYGELFGCDDEMLAYHKMFDRPTIFAGGSWSWCGHLPENDYMEIATRASLEACRRHGVDSAMMTIWLNNGAECPLFASLYCLSFMAELCYRGNPSEEELAARFAATTGADRAFFHDMGGYQNEFGDAEAYPVYSKRFLGKATFWQDPLEGLFDTHHIGHERSKHYAALAERFAAAPKDAYSYLYRFSERIFAFLSVKCRVAERLHPAYQAGDRDTLTAICREDLPALLALGREVHALHAEVWGKSYRSIGWAVLDRRYGGMTSRIETAIARLTDYLDGKVDTIPELEDARLYKGISGFLRFNQLVQDS